VEDLGATRHRAYQGPVLALVEERAALLAVLEVDVEAQAVLQHRQAWGWRLPPQRFELWCRAATPLRVLALRDPAHLPRLAGLAGHLRADRPQAGGVDLEHTVAAVAVQDDARQEVALAVDDPVRVGVARDESRSQRDGLRDPLGHQRGAGSLLAEEPDADGA